jgi:hypothetical protein|tara:strand:+ start:678 stop:899 length:222 start_codon:yes stop_codon:yes gene_type:complete
MKLEDWRLERGLTYKQLAEKLDAPGAGVVHRWCLNPQHPGYARYVRPSQEYMRRIKIATDGAVQPNDFFMDDV